MGAKRALAILGAMIALLAAGVAPPAIAGLLAASFGVVAVLLVPLIWSF